MTTQKKCDCGHRIDEHTYSENYCGCDSYGCGCKLDLGALIDAQAARIAALEAVLGDYLKNFDDESIGDLQLKKWLDNKWIPSARALLKGE